MRLKSVTVQRFRNFVEPQDVEIESDVTCFVGKNESGKTTILKALHRLKPANGSDTKFDLTTEYPRWRLALDRRNNPEILDTRPVAVRFALDDHDLDAMVEIFGVRPPAETVVEAARTYKGSKLVWLTCDTSKVISQADIDVDIAGDDLDDLLAAESYEEVRNLSKTVAKEMKDRGETLRGKAMTSFAPALAKYAFIYEHKIEQEQLAALWALLPAFFYFSSYNLLPGETDLNELKESLDSGGSIRDEERSVVALLAHAGETPADFMDADYDSRKAELQAASVDLSRHVFEYWKQNTDLEVIFDTDNIVVEEVSGNQRTHRILKIELRDGRHGNVETNFSTRSTGISVVLLVLRCL